MATANAASSGTGRFRAHRAIRPKRSIAADKTSIERTVVIEPRPGVPHWCRRRSPKRMNLDALNDAQPRPPRPRIRAGQLSAYSDSGVGLIRSWSLTGSLVLLRAPMLSTSTKIEKAMAA